MKQHLCPPFPGFAMIVSAFTALSLLAACSDTPSGGVSPPVIRGEFALTAPYDSIRSCPGGGGIFLVRIVRDSMFSGPIELRLEADASMHATVSPSSPADADTVVEVLLAPSTDCLPGTRSMTVVATHGSETRRLFLTVDVLEWSHETSGDALAKRDLFREFLVSESISYAELFAMPIRIYGTYPQTLIVEHYTEITPRFECRWCCHMMTPPHDWQMIRVRKRFALEAEIALRRETDGTIRQIPVEEYPTMYGY